VPEIPGKCKVEVDARSTAQFVAQQAAEFMFSAEPAAIRAD